MTGAPHIRALLTQAAIEPSSWAAAPGRPVAISFGGGLPDPATFPIDGLAGAFDTVLRRDASAALQYGGLPGFEGLREQVAAKLTREDSRAFGPEQVVLTGGSAQALSLACFAFVSPGDPVFIEAPTFPGSLRAIRAYRGGLIPLPMDGEGLIVEALEAELKRLGRRRRRPKLLYTIASFHNPAGTTLTAERRRRLVELAHAWGFLIVEDDAYGDLRYDGDSPPSLLSLDREGWVLKLGSFSKVLAAGLRLGWAAGHPDAVAALVAVRHDMGVSPLLCRAVAEFSAGGRLERHVEGLRAHYRMKRDRMAAALGERCGGYAAWRKPEGGFFFWLEAARGIDMTTLAQAAADEGVGYVPGPMFFAAGGGERNLRLAFSHVPTADIERGVAGLGRAFQRSAPHTAPGRT